MGGNNSKGGALKSSLKKFLSDQNEKNFDALLKIVDKNHDKKIDEKEITDFLQFVKKENDMSEENNKGITELINKVERILKNKLKELTFEEFKEFYFKTRIVLLGTGEVGKKMNKIKEKQHFLDKWK
jgi:Ca2+-binding EF-hand superfamily protein